MSNNNNNSNMLSALFDLVKLCFCSGNNQNQNQQQQQQQQGYPQQQQQQHYPQQQQQQQHGYPPQQHQPAPHAQPSYGGNQHGGGGGGWNAQGNHAGGYGQVVGPGHSRDPNMVNQSNAKYMAMREQAKKEGDLMRSCFERSKQAYSSGDGARAHELSEEGKRHQAAKARIDGEARDWIYYQNNTDSHPDQVDLHGLFVKEAIQKAEMEIQQRQQRGDRVVNFIVGKGNHSPGHVGKIRPAIEDLMEKYNLAAHLDPRNAGILVVELQPSAGGQHGRSRGVELGGELEQKAGGDCVVM